MAKILTVPVVAQPSSDTCWHASSEMIWLYWQGVTGRQGPMNTIAENYRNNHGVNPTQFVTLAEKVGLKKVPKTNDFLTSAAIEKLLTDYGPLWCAGGWYGPKHIIVLTGISGDMIYINDPDRGQKKTQNVAWFNLKLDKHVDGCLMHKNPAAY